MAKIFYDHLVVLEDIIIEVDKYEIEAIEREELIQLADETLHHRVLDVILTKLPKEKHEEFLVKFHQAPHDQSLLEYLKKEIENIEKLITDEAKKVKKELLVEIKRAEKRYS